MPVPLEALPEREAVAARQVRQEPREGQEEWVPAPVQEHESQTWTRASIPKSLPNKPADPVSESSPE
jgi:hypothetical protein